MASAKLTPAGVYGDQVRNIFGMSGGNSFSTTSNTSFLKRLATSTEENSIKSAANDNLMLREMQKQTQLLRHIKGDMKGGFGLTDFVMGAWLTKLTKFAATGLIGGIGAAGGLATGAVRGVASVVKATAVGAASLLKGTVLGVFKPITSGLGRLFAPLSGVAKSIGSFFKIPAMAGIFNGVTRAVPNLLKGLGSIASKIFWPLTAIIAAVDGIGGALNAEELLGRGDVSIFDRIQAGISSAINGVLFGLPNFLAEKLGFDNLANMVDVGIHKFHDAFGKQIMSFTSTVFGSIGNFMGQAGTWLKDSFFGVIDYVKSKIDPSKGMGENIGRVVAGAATDFGNFIKDSTIGIFSTLGNWVNTSFDNLKKEINSWLPWNWEQNKLYPVGTFPIKGGTFGNQTAFDYFTPIKPVVSADAAPVTQAATTSAYDLARLSAVDSMGINDLTAGGLFVSTGTLQTVGGINTPQTTTAQQIISNNENVLQSVDEGMEDIVKNADDAWSDMTKNVERGWFDLLKMATGNYGEAAKQTLDAMANFAPGAAKLYAEYGGINFDSLMGDLGGTSGAATGPTAPSTTGIMSPSVPQLTPSGESLPTVSPGSTEPRPVSGSVESDLINIMMEEGLTRKEAAARVGNMYVESYNTSTNTRYDPNVLGDNGSALGLMQWRHERRANLMKFAQERGLDPFARETQARFAVEESRKGSPYADPQSVAVQEWMRANPQASVEQMTEQFMWKAERPSTTAGMASLPGRQSVASSAMAIPTLAPAPIPANSNFDPDRIPDSIRDTRIKTAQGDKTLAQLGITNYSQLQAYGGQAFQGGYNDPNTLFMTGKFQDLLGDNFGRITAQNDLYHQQNSPTSGHTQGNKTDFTVRNMSYQSADSTIREYLASQGFTNSDYQIISKPHGTGPHIDFKLTPSGQQKAEQLRMAEFASQANIPQPSEQKFNEIGSGATWQGLKSFNSKGTGFGMELARNPISGGKSYLPYMDAGYDPTQDAMRFYSQGTAQVATAAPYVDPATGKLVGDFVSQPKELGLQIAQGIVDASIAQPKQPTFIPLETPPGTPNNTVTPPQSKVAENPTGTPSRAVDDRPDLGSMPTLDEFKLLLINSDMMGT